MDLRERLRSDRSLRHPWERSRAAFFLSVLARHGGARGRVLDAGAGDGWLAASVGRRWGAEIVCWDAYYTAEQLAELRAAEPGLQFVQQRPEGPYDLVMLLDVLEHVPNDVEFLRNVIRDLGPGGRVLISVPAWPALFSAHDVFLRHYRRYRPSEAASVIGHAGLRILESGGLFHGLLPVRVVQIGLERVLGGEPEAEVGLGGGPQGWMNEAITRALLLEQRLSHRAARAGVSLPGLSWYAVATR